MASDEDLGALRFWPVQDEVGFRNASGGVTPVVKCRCAKSGFIGGFEKTGGDDLVRIDVLDREGDVRAVAK